MTKMFPFINAKPLNALGGECKHRCVYCWVENLKKLYPNLKLKYSGEPRIIERELKRVKDYKEGDFIFVSDCTDLFGSWVPKEMIQKILDAVSKSPAKFLLLTKNPTRYHEFKLPKNCVAGATIESDIDPETKISSSPPMSERLDAMRELEHQKFISVEPILNFRAGWFLQKLLAAEPEFVAVGRDNYNNGLVEPSREDIEKLIFGLEQNGVKVFRKTI